MRRRRLHRRRELGPGLPAGHRLPRRTPRPDRRRRHMLPIQQVSRHLEEEKKEVLNIVSAIFGLHIRNRISPPEIKLFFTLFVDE